MSAVRGSVGRELLRATGPGAAVVIWGYYAVQVLLAVWTLPQVRSPWPTGVAVVLLAAVALAFTLDRRPRLGWGATAGTVLAGGVIVATLTPQVLEEGHPQWYFAACTFALFHLQLRGRIAAAWVGFALITAALLVAFTSSPLALSSELLLVARHAPVLVVGTLFATGLRRTREQIEQVTTARAAGAMTEAGANAATAERETRLHELGGFATPLLERLADGGPIAPADRREFAVAEAEVRDSVRARGLRLPGVVEAVREARRRGVEVVLLDDRGTPLDADAREAVAAAVIEVVEEAEDGRVTARLLPPGRPMLATIVADGRQHVSREVPAP